MERELPSFEAPPTPEAGEIVEAMLGDAPFSPALMARFLDPARLAQRDTETRALRDMDWANLARYEPANAQLAASGVRPDLVFMGDSISEYWPLADSSLFTPGRICRAISGQTSPQMLVRFHADVVAHRPRAVHLLAGTNDIAGATGPTTPYRYQCSMRAMVGLAQASGIEVLLGLIPPATRMPWRPELNRRQWNAELNAWLRVLAAETGCALVDYHAALDDGNGGLPAQYSHDGVHPNRRGYARMRSVLAPVLDRLGL